MGLLNQVIKSVPIAFFMLNFGTPVAWADSRFDGLYFPKNEVPPSSCSRIEQGLHLTGIKISDGTLYRGEEVCKLQGAQVTASGVEFIANCESEGEQFRKIITLEEMPNGMRLSGRKEKSEWALCQSTSEIKSKQIGDNNWSVRSFPDGTVERTLSNSQGDEMLFTCKNGGDGTIMAFLSSQDFLGGNLDISIDNENFNLMTWANRVEVNTECNVCVEHYYALMEKIRTGQNMTVIPNKGKPISFNLQGAADIFEDEVCGAKGWD